jgi:hypothetical protein
MEIKSDNNGDIIIKITDGYPESQVYSYKYKKSTDDYGTVIYNRDHESEYNYSGG